MKQQEWIHSVNPHTKQHGCNIKASDVKYTHAHVLLVYDENKEQAEISVNDMYSICVVGTNWDKFSCTGDTLLHSPTFWSVTHHLFIREMS